MLTDINKLLTAGQHSLEHSHKKQHTKNPKTKVVDTEVVVKTSDKPNLGILEKKFLFLNREKFEICPGISINENQSSIAINIIDNNK